MLRTKQLQRTIQRMVTYDFIMLAILGAALAWGIYKGFAWQVASVTSLVASYLVSIQLRGQVAQALGLDPPWGNLAAMLGLYLASSFGIWAVFGLINKTLDGLSLKDWDRQVGAALGLIQGLLLCIIVTMFAVALTKDESRQQIVQSQSGHLITQVIYRLHGVMPDEVSRIVDPYIIRYNQRVNGENPDWFANVDSSDLEGVQNQVQSTINQKTDQAVSFSPQNGSPTAGDFTQQLGQQWQNFQQDVQQQVQNRIQSEVQNQSNQVQNMVQQSIENPQNAQMYWNQYTGQWQQYQGQPSVPSPQQYYPQNVPQQQPQYYPQQGGTGYYPQYQGYYPQQPNAQPQQPYYGQ